VSKQVKAASLEAASSSTCVDGWALSGRGLAPGVPRCPEPPDAHWEGTAGELEHREDGHFDGAVSGQGAQPTRSRAFDMRTPQHPEVGKPAFSSLGPN